jgi:hypothetical protein
MLWFKAVSAGPCRLGLASEISEMEEADVSDASITAIQAMVVPAVLITTSAILAGGISTMYGAVNDRMRLMTSQRLDALTAADGALSRAEDTTGRAHERITEIDRQLPVLLTRHHLLGRALLLNYTAVLVLVLSVMAIALAIGDHSSGLGVTALVLVIAGTVTLLLAVVLTAQSIRASSGAVDYEVRRVLALGK